MFLDQLSSFCKRIINVFDKFLLFIASCVLDTSQVSNYHLIVQVKDLGNWFLGYCALATVGTAIVENTQVAPGAIFLPELLKVSYPQTISKVSQEIPIFKIIRFRSFNSDEMRFSCNLKSTLGDSFALGTLALILQTCD